MKYGIQFNSYSQKYRIVTKACGSRAAWYPMTTIYATNYDPFEYRAGKTPDLIPNNFDSKEAAIEVITRLSKEQTERDNVLDAWTSAATEEVTKSE